MSTGLIIALITTAAVAIWLWQRSLRLQRAAFIQQHKLPSLLSKAVFDTYPHLQTAQIQRVLLALKQYFLLCNMAPGKLIAMPSQAVDIAWHQYILSTRQYHQFCDKAFGRYLHHTPSEAMSSPTHAQQGIKRAWRLACAVEKISAKNPTRLPLLFAIDAELGIPNGFHYQLNCLSNRTGQQNDGYCASHIGCSSGCSGDSGSADGHSDSSSSGADSGCSSGCGGGD